VNKGVQERLQNGGSKVRNSLQVESSQRGRDPNRTPRSRGSPSNKNGQSNNSNINNSNNPNNSSNNNHNQLNANSTQAPKKRSTSQNSHKSSLNNSFSDSPRRSKNNSVRFPPVEQNVVEYDSDIVPRHYPIDGDGNRGPLRTSIVNNNVQSQNSDYSGGQNQRVANYLRRKDEHGEDYERRKGHWIKYF